MDHAERDGARRVHAGGVVAVVGVGGAGGWGGRKWEGCFILGESTKVCMHINTRDSTATFALLHFIYLCVYMYTSYTRDTFTCKLFMFL